MPPWMPVQQTDRALFRVNSVAKHRQWPACDAETPEKLAAAVALVAAYCRQRSTVQVADILAGMTDVSAAALDAHVLPALLGDGTLQRTSQADRYAVLHPRAEPVGIPSIQMHVVTLTSVSLEPCATLITNSAPMS